VLVPERLLEVSIFVGERDLEAVTARLMRAAVLHPDAHDSERWSPAPAWGDLAEAYRGLVQRLERVQASLGLPAGAPHTGLEPRPRSDQAGIDTAALRFETRVASWRERADAVAAEQRSLEAAIRQLELLHPLEAPVEALRRLRHHHLTIGTLPAEHVERVAAALFQVAFVLVPLERRGDRSLVALATAREDAHVLDRALASAFFEPIDLPAGAKGLPDDALAAVQADLDTVRAQAAELELERADTASAIGADLLETLERARLDLELCEALRRFPCREGVYVIGGWLPVRHAEAIEAEVRSIATEPVVIETLPPARGRTTVPSLMRNPPWLKPFEPLVTTFGLAGYDELNPTLVTTVVFLFMYGMMFGDIGHGVLLALGGLLLRRVTPFGTVVVAAGAASTVFGALYGVAFGAEVMHPLWLQPLHAIFPLLIASVVAGVVILNLGFLLNLITAWRNGDAQRFWLDTSGVLGVALYWTLLGGGLLVFTGALSSGVWWLVLGPLMAAMWFREPLAALVAGGQAHWGGHVATGFFELFEAVIAFLSNTLSFVRLGAFAVAHEGLSGMVLQYSGGSTGWITFLIGTLVIVGFEGLIVGIQALRLQYYEFFGRFFRGRGRPFRPLAFAGGPDA